MSAGQLEVTNLQASLDVVSGDHEQVVVCAEQNSSTTYGRLLLCVSQVLNGLVRRVVRLLQVGASRSNCDTGSQVWLARALNVLLSICRDEVCVNRAGQLGLHRSLLRLSMHSCGDVTIDTLVNELLDVCGATCTKNELHFPVKYLPIEPDQVDVHQLCATRGHLRLNVLLRLASSTIEMGDKANYDVGYRLWGAAVVLCKLIFCEKLEVLRGKSVLEIGAGIGILGLFAGHPLVEAKSVEITDFNVGVIRHLQYNIQLNQSYWETTFGDRKGCCSSYMLDWDQEISKDQKYDVILGSDLICQESDAFNVLKVMDKLLEPDGTVFITLGSAESRYGVARFEKLLEESAEWISEKLVHKAAEGSIDGSHSRSIFVGEAKSYTTFQVRRRFNF